MNFYSTYALPLILAVVGLCWGYHEFYLYVGSSIPFAIQNNNRFLQETSENSIAGWEIFLIIASCLCGCCSLICYFIKHPEQCPCDSTNLASIQPINAVNAITTTVQTTVTVLDTLSKPETLQMIEKVENAYDRIKEENRKNNERLNK